MAAAALHAGRPYRHSTKAGEHPEGSLLECKLAR